MAKWGGGAGGPAPPTPPPPPARLGAQRARAPAARARTARRPLARCRNPRRLQRLLRLRAWRLNWRANKSFSYKPCSHTTPTAQPRKIFACAVPEGGEEARAILARPRPRLMRGLCLVSPRPGPAPAEPPESRREPPFWARCRLAARSKNERARSVAPAWRAGVPPLPRAPAGEGGGRPRTDRIAR